MKFGLVERQAQRLILHGWSNGFGLIVQRIREMLSTTRRIWIPLPLARRTSVPLSKLCEVHEPTNVMEGEEISGGVEKLKKLPKQFVQNAIF